MRCIVLLLAVVLCGSPTSAQEAGPACPAASKPERVDVDVAGEGTIRGTLFCLSPNTLKLLREGMLVEVPLTRVRRITKPADPVWDGAVKGAAVVLTMWGVTCGFCEGGSTYMWRAVAGYAALGATIDALQTNRKTIYVGRQAAALNVRLSF